MANQTTDARMKRIGALLLAALAVSTGLPAQAAPSRGGEHRLNAEEIRDLASKQMMWCDGFHADTDDCQIVTLVTLMPDGRIGQTATWVEEEDPMIQIYVGEVDHFDGDRICSVVDTTAIPVGVTVNGKAVSSALTQTLKPIIDKMFASLQGKVVCQAFYRGADPTHLREEVTVNGRRQPELESNYVLRPGGDGFALRNASAGAKGAKV
jgi:hypothetical protein